MADQQLPEIKLDTDNLYREETFTDQKVGTIRRMTPVTSDGSDDPSRPVQYIGQAQMMTPAGPLPLTFELEASALSEALALFPEAANQALEDTMRELQEMRRQQASQIVVPGAEQSKIHMP